MIAGEQKAVQSFVKPHGFIMFVMQEKNSGGFVGFGHVLKKGRRGPVVDDDEVAFPLKLF